MKLRLGRRGGDQFRRESGQILWRWDRRDSYAAWAANLTGA